MKICKIHGTIEVYESRSRGRAWVDFIQNISNPCESKSCHSYGSPITSPTTERNSLFLLELVHGDDVLSVWRPIFVDSSKI